MPQYQLAAPLPLPSHQYVCIVAGILLATTFIFFSIEQAQIRRNVNSSKQALAEQSTIEANNAELEAAKNELQAEENECVLYCIFRCLLSQSRFFHFRSTT